MIDYNAMTEADLITEIRKDWSTIERIKNPSEAVQIAAVEENGYAIEHIENPSEAVQLAAVLKSPSAIWDIKNPLETVQVATVKINERIINYLPAGNNVLAATQLIYHPLSPHTLKEILDRAPSILEAYCMGLGDVYTIGLSMNMAGEELSKTMIEWIENHHGQAVTACAEMAP